jgi:hypothetical protein
MTRRRLPLLVICAFVFSLPMLPLFWNSQGSGTAVVLSVCLLAFLVGVLFVARRYAKPS